MKRVVVHIDRLVLNGFRREDRHAIAAALQQELGRVFAEHEAVSALRDKGDVGRLRVDGVQFEPDSKPQQIGESVAQGIDREIKP
jgi:hypothetical protein